MASLDFVYDLTDRFEEDNIEYVVVALREGKALDKVDVFDLAEFIFVIS